MKYLCLFVIFLLSFMACKQNNETKKSTVEVFETDATWVSLYNFNDTIRDLANSDNYIWVATQNKGLLRVSKHLEETRLTYFNPTNSGLTDVSVNCVETAGNIIWAGTRSKGLFRFDGVSWQNFSEQNSPLPSNKIFSLAITKSGELWIGSTKGLTLLKDTIWTIYDTTNSDIKDQVLRKVVVDGNDNLWFGTLSGGLGKLANGQIESFTSANSPLFDPMIRTIAFDEQQNLWTSTFYKFYTFNGINWHVYDMDNTGISSNYVNDIAIENNNVEYYCTHNGFTIHREGIWEQFYKKNSMLPDNIVEAIVIDENNNKWVGTFGGLVVYNAEGVLWYK